MSRLLETHLNLLRSIVEARQPIAFQELAAEVEKRAGDAGIPTSRSYIARVVIGSTANIEPARLLFPSMPGILLVSSDGRYGLAR